MPDNFAGMSSKTVRFSKCNPFLFVKENLAASSMYGYPAPNRALAKETTQPGQVEPYFEYKAQLSDRICLQFHRPFTEENVASNWTQVIITDACGNPLKTLTYTTATSETDYSLDDGEKLYTDQYSFRFGNYDELDGYDRVRLRLKVQWGDYDTEVFITDLIHLAARHEHTILIKVTNDTNDFDTLFEQLRPSFYYRIPSSGYLPNPASEYTVAEDQNNELTKLYGNSYSTLKYDIGGDEGITDYQSRTLDVAFDCDRISIDGIPLDREKDAKLERTAGEGMVLKSYSIVLREANGSQANTFTRSVITLFNRPYSATFKPWVLHGFEMRNGADVMIFPTFIFESEGDEAGYVEYILQTGNNMYDFGGTFAVDGNGVFTYENGADENFTASTVFISNMVFNLTITASNAGFFVINVNNNGKMLADWGDLVKDYYPPQFSTAFQVKHKYLTNGNKNIRLFIDEYMWRFVIGEQFFGTVKNMWGDMSFYMEKFHVTDQDFSALTELDISFLSRASTRMQELNLTFNKIKAIATGWSNQTPKSWPLLKYISLVANEMPVADVDSFWSDFYTRCLWSYGGQFLINGQNPAATPTSGTLTQMNNLSTSYGWTVTHD